MKQSLLVLFWLPAFHLPGIILHCQTRIIDMHLHSYTEAHFTPPVKDYYGNTGAPTAEVHFSETYAVMRKYHIVRAMVSGSLASVDEWKAKDADHRIIRGLAMDEPTEEGMDSVKLETLIKAGKIEVFGEIGTYYSGSTLSDSAWQPYLRLCEKYDIPVALHTGGGDPGGTYSWSPKARLKFGDPYLMEEVLVRYPRLRIYLMHSGEDWYEHALRLMAYYPQLYSDIGAMLWVEPLDQGHVTDFLRKAKKAGYLDRVMFGTDQMRWPYAIGTSISFLNSLPFLTAADKENIFYNNAARFLRLNSVVAPAASPAGQRGAITSGLTKSSSPKPPTSNTPSTSTPLPTPPAASATNLLTGAWKVQADQQLDNMGNVIAQDTAISGLLIYTPEGKMSVQILWRGRRTPIMTDAIMDRDGNSTGLGIGTNTWSPDQRGTILDTYDAYFGDYSVDASTKTVTHILSGNLRPEKAGTLFRRRYRLQGDVLFLTSTDPTMKWQVQFLRVNR